MALWKRGRRYWTHFVINGVHFRKPLRSPGASLATTNWQEAKRLEKQLIEAAQNGRLEARSGPHVYSRPRKRIWQRRRRRRTPSGSLNSTKSDSTC